eukprot:gene4678-4931_t
MEDPCVMSGPQLDKVLQLLLRPDSEALHERHIAAIHKLCRINASGVSVTDLQQVSQVVNITLQMISRGHAQFVAPLCQLIRTLKKPYIRKTSTDELKLMGIVTGLLQVLTRSLDRAMPEQLQACTAEAKDDRNDILVVLHQLSKTPGCCAAFSHSSFLQVALDTAVTPELQSSTPLAPVGAVTQDEASYEMKQLLWALLGNLAVADEGCRVAVMAGRLPQVLLMTGTEQSNGFWNPDQQAGLQQAAWSILIQDQLRKAEGVAVLLKECDSILQGDVSMPSLHALAALDCLWRCCLKSARSRAQLLAMDGLDVLLQLLMQGSKQLRPVVLSMLADLLADKRSHRFFLEWYAPVASTDRTSCFAASLAGCGPYHLHGCPAVAADLIQSSRSNPVISATQLLIAIWREQDAARGISGVDGLLANPAKPLSGTGNRSKWPVLELAGAASYCSLAPDRQQVLRRLNDMSSNPDLIMDKVYACLAQLPASALMSNLHPADSAVLCLILQYVEFRKGEVWQDIKQQLAAEAVQPTEEDGIRLQQGIEQSVAVATAVKQQQAALLAQPLAAD